MSIVEIKEWETVPGAGMRAVSPRIESITEEIWKLKNQVHANTGFLLILLLKMELELILL